MGVAWRNAEGKIAFRMNTLDLDRQLRTPKPQIKQSDNQICFKGSSFFVPINLALKGSSVSSQQYVGNVAAGDALTAGEGGGGGEVPRRAFPGDRCECIQAHVGAVGDVVEGQEEEGHDGPASWPSTPRIRAGPASWPSTPWTRAEVKKHRAWKTLGWGVCVCGF